MIFPNRTEAGRQLAARLAAYSGRDDVVVLALPRGGVPVAFEVAQALGAPLDVFLVRKLGMPGREELALGAIATGGVRVLNDELIQSLQVPNDVIEQVTAEEQRELVRRERAYRDDRPAPELRDRMVILIDDGLATGATMRAAVAALRQQHPKQIIVAAPIGAPETCTAMREVADQVICARMPEPFYGVGLWYDDFSQTTDEEVRQLLAHAAARAAEAPDLHITSP
jgi:predicted phosphoribosyltransferase